MQCYQCQCELGTDDVCPVCGADVTIYKKIIALSNRHYNEGLEQARIRDLSGATVNLSRSLHYNKRNTQARNLLGLVYYERGRLSEALREWIISVNLQPEDNEASKYLKYFQDADGERGRMNDAARNYNTCLKYMQSGNEDLAVLHIKKVLADKPKLVEVYQLMAMLCMKNRQYSQAKKFLGTAIRMDRGNLKTLQYISELQAMGGGNVEVVAPEMSGVRAEHAVIYKSGNETIIQPKLQAAAQKASGLKRFFNARYIGGFLLVLALLTWFLLIPAYVKGQSAQANETVRAYHDDMQAKEEEITALTKERDDAKAAVAEALGTSEEQVGVVEGYEVLIDLYTQWNNESYSSIGMLDGLTGINRDILSPEGQNLYDKLKNNVYDEALANVYSQGMDEYGWGAWDEAMETFEKVCSYDEGYNDAAPLYYLGLCAVEDHNNAKARASFEKLIADHPNSGFAPEAKLKLNELNVAASGESYDSGTDTDYSDETYSEDADYE